MKRALSVMLASAFVAAMGPVASAQEPELLTVRVNPLNNSGVTGTATLAPTEDGTRVVLDLIGTTGTTPLLAHIHNGTCAQLGQPAFALSPVINGMSDTVVGTQMDALAVTPQAISIHAGETEDTPTLACADIQSGTGGAAPGGVAPRSGQQPGGAAPGQTAPGGTTSPSETTPGGAMPR